MSFEKRLEILKQIAETANLAGMRGEIAENGHSFAMGFELGEGRRQLIFVAPHHGPSFFEKEVVTVWSVCLRVKKGMFSGLSKDRAFELLKRNQVVPFARYGILENDSEMLIVASADHLLETLDPEELRHTAYAVAMAADVYEKEYSTVDQH